MAFTRDEIQWMAGKGWDIQPDGVTFRDESVANTKWITQYHDGTYFAFQVTLTSESTYDEEMLTEFFDSPIAVVVSLEIDRSNNQ